VPRGGYPFVTGACQDASNASGGEMRTPLVVAALTAALVVGCTTTPATSVSPLSQPAPVSKVSMAGFPAKGCAADQNPVVTFTMYPDGPFPTMGCAIVGRSQRLRVVNATNAFNQKGGPLTVSINGLPARMLRAGQSTTYEQPFGSYLPLGQTEVHLHYLSDNAVIVWLK
jgi:hypothetical protein